MRKFAVYYPIRLNKAVFCHICNKFSYNLLARLGVDWMREATQDRAVALGEYIIETGATVRATAKQFNISKSTVHKDVAERLKKIQPQIYAQAKIVLERNKAQRHIRGGMATRRKYKGE
jgi:putative DeoR family transcriptional regulator (stage III sporulation protein D)